MKKSLLILGAVVAFAAGASAQGVIYIQSPATAGFNSVSSVPTDSAPSGTFGDFYNGSLSLEIFSIAYSSTAANEAATINADAGSGTAGTKTAIGLLATDGFTQQTYTGGTNVFSIGTGAIGNTETVTLGNASSLPAGGSYLFAILAQNASWEGVLVLNNPSAVGSTGYTPGVAAPGTPNSMAFDWGNNQNVLLVPVPEPATLALAGLGGLSMLFLRRRKA